MKPVAPAVRECVTPENEERYDDGDGAADAGAEEAVEGNEHNAENDDDKEATNANRTTPHRPFEDLSELSDEDCLLTAPLLYGFDIKAKEWGMYCHNHMHNTRVHV